MLLHLEVLQNPCCLGGKTPSVREKQDGKKVSRGKNEGGGERKKTGGAAFPERAGKDK